MDTLKVGMRDEMVWEVTEDLATSRGDYKVFSTPGMTRFVEMTAHKLVRCEVELVAIDRRKLTFKMKVFDEVEQIGEAEHDRYVVDLDKYMARLKAKIEGAPSAAGKS